MSTLEEIRTSLATLQPSVCEIEDESHRHAGHAGARGGGGHFRLRIVSAHFNGLPLLARHRLIHTTLGALMQGPIHALSITASTPEEASSH
ncbi:MAG: BolA family transcriptional regulator [Candidatus Dactylopiibacterium carminicum]|uniref:BolA family transcriptional regulator n=1 Tax=Candidatus Dactylopiibacterium carminicum TaxID=857335 RepID=A0A272EW09_9RHOO|nr:BolA family protein [Candidatus Dactylopiibacterium carminicum]KAF7600332.1 BolA family transcriptional regulator [Candidatus Dactylopiibacterium carminicum]PAS93840.1 MAG: BolA family transcriptional regulator [Candidatus Dactylopiibacterium carminicum]PAS95633.1 MAG: BolA family transcriptional regulator [Candidatus Dactylopiibacterium carminicum]PAT00335.1 MAG: BolA family transcriptional regulator [Candidatus Dactylopiibacterium carminicum]